MQVNVVGNTLINNMCSATDPYTYLYVYPWTHSSQPFSFTNITGLTFTGNTLTQNSGCAVSMVRAPLPQIARAPASREERPSVCLVPCWPGRMGM